MTWNIQDGGILDRDNPVLINLQNILDTIEHEQPDILIIQEFKYSYNQILVENGLKKIGYLFCIYDEVLEEYTERYGVLIASKINCEPIEKSQNIKKYSWRNWNEVLVPIYNLHILGVHVPLAVTSTIANKKKQNTREKRLFLDELNVKFKEYEKNDTPSLILGDFNLHEKAKFKESIDKFSSNLTEVTTKDATHREYKFDYIFGNKEIVNKLQGKYEPVWTEYSDHAYLLIDIKL